jgi:hypothetical protein
LETALYLLFSWQRTTQLESGVRVVSTTAQARGRVQEAGTLVMRVLASIGAGCLLTLILGGGALAAFIDRIGGMPDWVLWAYLMLTFTLGYVGWWKTYSRRP